MARLGDQLINTGIPVTIASLASLADYIERGQFTVWQILAVPGAWCLWQLARWAESAWQDDDDRENDTPGAQ